MQLTFSFRAPSRAVPKRLLALAATLTMLAVGLLPADAPAGAAKWRVSYFYDELKTSLVLQDVAFLGSQRIIGAGSVFTQKGKGKPIFLVSSNGGRKWDLEPAPDDGTTMFFLNDSLGWMATDKAIWRTQEAGRGWQKLAKLEGVHRLHFLDENHGFAIGAQKLVSETKDGGKTWTKVDVADRIKTTEEWTHFVAIDFFTPKSGLIMGFSHPPTPPDARELPRQLISLESKDAGATWNPEVVSAFGTVAKLKLAQDFTGYLLMQFQHRFTHASEIYALDVRNKKNISAFKSKNVFLTDVAPGADGWVYTAGVVRNGDAGVPQIPSAVKVFRSKDLEKWEEMPVDYRATATRVYLGVASPEKKWLATDTGMVLQWGEQ